MTHYLKLNLKMTEVGKIDFTKFCKMKSFIFRKIKCMHFCIFKLSFNQNPFDRHQILTLEPWHN